MSRKIIVGLVIGLIFSQWLHRQALCEENAQFSSAIKQDDAHERVYRLKSEIAYTLERAKKASDSLSTNDTRAAGIRQGIMRVYHATVMRKIQQFLALLKEKPELGTKYDSLGKALERTNQNEKLRESQAAEMEESKKGDEYWKNRLQEIRNEVLPSLVSSNDSRVIQAKIITIP